MQTLNNDVLFLIVDAIKHSLTVIYLKQTCKFWHKKLTYAKDNEPRRYKSWLIDQSLLGLSIYKDSLKSRLIALAQDYDIEPDDERNRAIFNINPDESPTLMTELHNKLGGFYLGTDLYNNAEVIRKFLINTAVALNINYFYMLLPFPRFIMEIVYFIQRDFDRELESESND